MKPAYSTDATYLHAQAVNLHQRDPGVEVQHHLRDDSGTVTDYYVQLTPHDARRLARQLLTAADQADKAAADD